MTRRARLSNLSPPLHRADPRGGIKDIDGYVEGSHTMGMELDRALRLLELTEDCTKDGLNESYRRLAKKYHPDANRGSERAHLLMTELNLALETVLSYIETGSPVVERGITENRPTFQSLLNRSINRVLDGVFTYYQYGLENVHLRREGIRRFRFRDTIRYLKEGLGNLKRLEEKTTSPRNAARLSLFIDFSEAFLQNVLIDRTFAPSGVDLEHGAYRHFRDGSECLDYAIKDVFFGDELIQVRRGTALQMMEKSRTEFLAVLMKYRGNSWTAETLLKLYTLDMFMRVVNYLNSVRH
jgi:hypothetical protein